MSNILERLYEAFDRTPIVDTHSHLVMREDLYDYDQDILQDLLTQYLQDDLYCAGMMPAEAAFAADKTQPLRDRFPVFQKYWNRTRNTGYARLAQETLRACYGVEELTEENIEALNAQYRKELETPGFYTRGLREKCNIVMAVSDHSVYEGIDFQYDPAQFAPVMRLDHLIRPRDGADLARVERECGFPINSLDDMVDAVHAVLDRAVKNGAVGLKSGLAYERSLYYAFPDYAEARQGFEGIRRSRITLYDNIQYPFVTSKAYQDFIMHEILREANRRGMVYQFHTGIQVGQGNHQEWYNPLLLNNLFLEYKNVKFDIFHAGYPHFYQLAALAKQFPNVYADLCWTHVISPLDARTALRSWLSAVPVCKILGFGDDLHSIWGVQGHLRVARENICRALAAEIEEGLRSFEECQWILQRILHDNAAELFGLDC